ncbi:MAG: type IV secretion system protein [Rickettsiales bacterium]|nr:type IV secretion system protein [Rickettsiales bacterium]
MNILRYNKISKFFSCAFLILLITITNIHDSYALMGSEYGVGRIRSCDSDGDWGGLDFNPTTGGKDIEFVVTNPICATVIATTYAIVISSIAAMNGICGTGSAIPRLIPSPIQDAWDIGRGTYTAASKSDAACASSVAFAVSSWTATFIELGIIYGIAQDTFKNSQICGFDWKKPNSDKYDFSADKEKEKRNLEIEKRLREYQLDPVGYESNPEKAKLLGLTSGGVDAADKVYREWYYGGIEVEDLPADYMNDETCLDPLRNNAPQRYYLRGIEPGNFNCERYIPNQNIKGVSKNELSKAYGCCLKRSREYICIDFKGFASSIFGGTLDAINHIPGVDEGTAPTQFFCRGGKLCDIYGVVFSTKFLDNDRLICAESYSLCPYNFTISGGTEVCERYQDGKRKSSGYWDIIDPEQIEEGNCASNSEIRNTDCTYNEKAGKCMNYCQYLTHCAYTSSLPFDYKSTIGTPYASTACLDFQGDSQNKNSYSTLRHFSLPIAQCMKETLENLFYNRAGHSVCANVDEYPDENGLCRDGNYAKTVDGYDYKKGGRVEHKSFFERIQDSIRDFVRIMLVFAVTFFGAGVLVGKVNLGDKKTIIMFIVKFSLVIYFTLGTAWQSQFFNGVYNASSDFAMMVFKINAGEEELKRDGCQFGDISLPDGTIEDSGRQYPPGKKYLAMFDTLDCKLARYLGFGPEVSAANIAKLVLAGYFVGPVGIYFSLCLLILGFFMLALTIRALHIFLSASFAIILMVVISPIIIPTVLFEKTNNIFKGWIKNLIAFTLQPMILFAYVAIFITVMDSTMVGSAVFTGTAPNKKISCAKNCYFKDTGLISVKNDGVTSSDCIQQNEEFIDPMNDSILCLLNIDSFGSWPGLEWLGLSIPIIENIFDGNVKQKILTLIKGALIMILLYGFMDEISGIAAQIIGGASLPSSKSDPMAMFSKVAGKPSFSLSKGMEVKGGAVNAVERRMTRGSQQLLKKGASMAKDAAAKYGSGGKGAEDAGGDSGGDGGNDSKSDESSSDSSSGSGGSSSGGSDQSGSGK